MKCDRQHLRLRAVARLSNFQKGSWWPVIVAVINRSGLERHDPSTACGRLGSRNNSGFDLYRVNFEVNNLKPFACLAFPQTAYLKTPRKQPIFGDELVTSFCRSTSPTRIFCKNGFGTWRGHAANAGYGLTGYRESKRNRYRLFLVESPKFHLW